jgi:hypothetical protein
MRYLKWAMLVTVCATSVGVLLVGLRGCSVAPVSFAKRNYAGSLDLPLSGRYELAIHSFLTGTIRGRIAAEASADRTSFVANSRPGVAWSMIGGHRVGTRAHRDAEPLSRRRDRRVGKRAAWSG